MPLCHPEKGAGELRAEVRREVEEVAWWCREGKGGRKDGHGWYDLARMEEDEAGRRRGKGEAGRRRRRRRMRGQLEALYGGE